jgi:hypothetical protein
VGEGWGRRFCWVHGSRWIDEEEETAVMAVTRTFNPGLLRSLVLSEQETYRYPEISVV